MKTVLLIYLALVVCQFILAFICGPHSCEWGNTVYVWYGLIALLLIFCFPYFRSELPIYQRMAYSIGLSALWGVLWAAGFIAGGLRIMCKLF
jgi:hypothetical protein